MSKSTNKRKSASGSASACAVTVTVLYTPTGRPVSIVDDGIPARKDAAFMKTMRSRSAFDEQYARDRATFGVSLSVAQIRARVVEIDNLLAGNDEVQQLREILLWRDVLQVISRGATNAQELACEALETLHVPIDRPSEFDMRLTDDNTPELLESYRPLQPKGN